MSETETSPPVKTPAKKSRKKLIITLSVLGLIAAALLGTWIWLQTPIQPKEYPMVADPALVEKNQALYMALTGGGLSAPFVDVNAERVLVVYEAPEPGMTIEALANVQRMVIGASHSVAPESNHVTIVASHNGEACLIWQAPFAEYATYLAGTQTAEAFESKVNKEILPACR